MDFSVLDISSFLGLSAIVVLTVNFLLGMLLGTAYKKHAYWKKVPAFVKRAPVVKIHNVTAYVALALLMLHPVVLLFDGSTKFTLAGILLPFFAPLQQIWVAIGIISLYCLVMVVVTSLSAIRKNIRFRIWKNIHLISYISLIMICFHGIFMDPQLKNRAPDFIDAEKLLCELCLILLLVATVLRYRYYLRHQAVVVKEAGL